MTIAQILKNPDVFYHFAQIIELKKIPFLQKILLIQSNIFFIF
jgi:hypothetical protein